VNLQGASTAIMLAIAAVLWFLYFTPALARRRDAREARRAAEIAEPPVRSAPRARPRAALAVRRRRTRLIATTLLAAAAVALGVQVWLAATTGVVVGTWIVLALAALVGAASAALLVALARPAAARPAARAPRAAGRIDVPLDTAVPVVEDRAWTPAPLPRPRYLAEPEPIPAPAVDHAELLRAAAAESERALREAQRDVPRVPAVPAPSPSVSPSPSRWARMGVLSDADAERTDLDEVLRRRRQVG